MKDKEIIKLYLNRDEQAIKETDIKYGNYCTSIAKNILNNDEDVKECINDTYLQTWNSIPPNKPKSLSLFIGKITSTEVILDTGSIKRLPVKFKIDGTDIETVRFSCKNQEIEFMDWNEKRPEYGSVQNCTICFGEDENDYNGLIFTWYNWKIKSLINDEESNISSLPQEVKEEVIVMQIKYLNGVWEVVEDNKIDE